MTDSISPPQRGVEIHRWWKAPPFRAGVGYLVRTVQSDRVETLGEVREAADQFVRSAFDRSE